MSATAEKSDPALWDAVKAEITAGDKGGKPRQWSARKAQMASHEYQKRGGGYLGERDAHHRGQEEGPGGGQAVFRAAQGCNGQGIARAPP